MYSTTIGQLNLGHFVYNASGVWDTTISQCQELATTQYCGATVTKSCTLQDRKGNQYPKYHFNNPHYSINSNGLESLEFDYYLENVPGQLVHPVFYSIGGLSNDERVTMVQKVCQYYQPGRNIGIELNMSCPNLDCVGPAYTPEVLDRALHELFEVTGNIELTFGLKLPPYYLGDEYKAITAVLGKYSNNIDFITCINSVPNGIDYDIDNNMPIITPNDGYGGIGGPAVLPIGLANVCHFRKLFHEKHIDIRIIGCGGVTTGADLYKYMLAGASAVQVGTHLWKNGPQVFEQLSTEFRQIMQRKGYSQLSEIPHA